MCSTEKEIRENYEDACDTIELQAKYEVVGFQAPLVSVIRKADGVKGTMQFQHRPRMYFGFHAILLLILLFTTPAHASHLDIWSLDATDSKGVWNYVSTDPHGEYNEITGNVTFYNIPDYADSIFFFMPTRSLAVDPRDITNHYVRQVRPKTFSILHDLMHIDRPYGFDSPTLDLGEIMKPGEKIFKWTYMGVRPAILTTGSGDPWVIVTVPEPGSGLLLLLSVVVVWASYNIGKM